MKNNMISVLWPQSLTNDNDLVNVMPSFSQYTFYFEFVSSDFIILIQTCLGTAPHGVNIVFPYDHINRTSIGW